MWDFEINNLQDFLLGDLTFIDGKNKFSIGAFVNLESQGANRTIFARDDGAGIHEIRLYFTTNGVNNVANIPKLLVVTSGVAARAEPVTPNLFTVGANHYLGASWERTQPGGLRLNFDGVDQALTNPSTVGQVNDIPDNSTAPFYVGRRGATSDRWDGKIGHITLWDDILTTLEWLAIMQGVHPLQIRSDSVVFHSDMLSNGTEYAIMPKLGTVVLFVPEFTSVAPVQVGQDYQCDFSWLENLFQFVSVSTGGYGPWQTIGVSPVSNFSDSDVINGKSYKYRVVAVDTSNNKSAASSEVTVTPNSGTSGPAVVPGYRPNMKHLLASIAQGGRK